MSHLRCHHNENGNVDGAIFERVGNDNDSISKLQYEQQQQLHYKLENEKDVLIRKIKVS